MVLPYRKCGPVELHVKPGGKRLGHGFHPRPPRRQEHDFGWQDGLAAAAEQVVGGDQFGAVQPWLDLGGEDCILGVRRVRVDGNLCRCFRGLDMVFDIGLSGFGFRDKPSGLFRRPFCCSTTISIFDPNTRLIPPAPTLLAAQC